MPEHPDSPAPRTAGRPPTIDPEGVAASALLLFSDRGYEAISMEEIAASVGIGRKSLYRYFPSKAALVWGGLDEAADASRRALEDLAGRGVTDVLQLLGAASAAAATSLPDLAVTRGRLRLIANHPELGAQAYSRLDGQRRDIAGYLCAAGMDEDDAYYLSIAYSATLFAGWISWARGESEEPLPYLMRAIRVLRLPGE